MDRRHSSFKCRHESWLDKGRKCAVLRKGSHLLYKANSIRKLDRNYTHTIHDNNLMLQTLCPELKRSTKSSFQKLLPLHHRTSRHEILRKWVGGSRKESVSAKNQSHQSLLFFDRLWHAPPLDRKRSTSFTSVLWMVDRGLLKWNDYLPYWQTSRFP